MWRRETQRQRRSALVKSVPTLRRRLLCLELLSQEFERASLRLRIASPCKGEVKADARLVQLRRSRPEVLSLQQCRRAVQRFLPVFSCLPSDQSTLQRLDVALDARVLSALCTAQRRLQVRSRLCISPPGESHQRAGVQCLGAGQGSSLLLQEVELLPAQRRGLVAGLRQVESMQIHCHQRQLARRSLASRIAMLVRGSEQADLPGQVFREGARRPSPPLVLRLSGHA
eukprot:scaffold825_cov249-Pinguiococcus_pyrenoidosus.AAC.44